MSAKFPRGGGAGPFLARSLVVSTINKALFFYKYKLSQKTLFTLNIYKIVIRLKSQALSKADSRLVADRQTRNHFFFAQVQSPWNTGLTRSPPELSGWSKVTTTSFL